MGLQMTNKNIKLILLFFIIISVVLISFIGINNKDKSTIENKEQDAKQEYSIPLLENISKIKDYDDSLVENLNISSSLNTSIYQSNASIKYIVDWYSVKENRKNWTIKKSGIKAENPDKPELITFGYVELKREETGLYIFCINQSGYTILGTAIGKYSEIEGI